MNSIAQKFDPQNINGPVGFDLNLKLEERELAFVHSEVLKQYRARLAALYNGVEFDPETVDLEGYHKICHLIEHKRAWPKSARIFSHSVGKQFREMKFFKHLESIYGPLLIANEEEQEPEEVYWRIVRPNEENDVGDVHADAWYWELGHGKIPAGYERLKIWMPIVSEPGKNGLQMVPGSHLIDDWNFSPIERDGLTKPEFHGNAETIGLELLPLEPGDMVIFHDRMVHKGAVNRGTKCRVSVEMTLFFKPDA